MKLASGTKSRMTTMYLTNLGVALPVFACFLSLPFSLPVLGLVTSQDLEASLGCRGKP